VQKYGAYVVGGQWQDAIALAFLLLWIMFSRFSKFRIEYARGIQGV
jgi:hypothetical protein